MALEKNEITPPDDSEFGGFFYNPNQEVPDLTGEDVGSKAFREIANKLGIEPEVLYAQHNNFHLLEVFLGWIPGNHWNTPTEYNNHQEYQQAMINSFKAMSGLK